MNLKNTTTSLLKNSAKISFKERFFVNNSHGGGHGGSEKFKLSDTFNPLAAAKKLNDTPRVAKFNDEVIKSSEAAITQPIQDVVDSVKSGYKDTVADFKGMKGPIKSLASIPGQALGTALDALGGIVKVPINLAKSAITTTTDVASNIAGAALNVATMPIDFVRGALRVPLLVADKLRIFANKPSKYLKKFRNSSKEKVQEGFSKVESTAKKTRQKAIKAITFDEGGGKGHGAHPPAAAHH
ncbi:MAG: hypothetical protein AAB373_01005 [Patescibacteria group bacterium]